MATTETMAETVKDAIRSGVASDFTVTTLQSLLSGSPGTDSKTVSTVQPFAGTSRVKTARKTAPPIATSRKLKKDHDFIVHEDSAGSLSPKARFVLATDIVNISLKALPQTYTNPPRSPGTCKSGNGRALQSRSGNATTDRTGLTKSSDREQDARSSLSDATASTGQLKATAECARLAFSYLRSIDCHKLGVKPLPEYQLESGMLSLVGRMINARLDALAVKELRIVKRRLGQACNVIYKQSKSARTGVEDRETLASLLWIDWDLTSNSEIMPLVVAYHTNVLRLISRSSKPAVAEEACQYLGPEVQGSPVHAIKLLLKNNGDTTKASRQLETVVSLILQICPSVSPSADLAAQDCHRNPEPVTVFMLHMHALKARQEMWKIVRHQVDVEKDLAEPFSKCLGALMRRLSGGKHTSHLHGMCKSAYNDLIGRAAPMAGHVQSSAIFAALRILFGLAHKAGLHDDAQSWAEQAIEQCAGFEGSNIRLIAASSMKLSVDLARIGTGVTAARLGSGLNSMNDSLRGKWTGSPTDFEILLEELASLMRCDGPTADEGLRTSWRTVCFLSAGFASRYAKSYPGSDGCKLASEVVQAAVSRSRTTEDIVSWATKESAHALIRSGALENVFEVSNSRSLIQAWSSSTSAFALNRILKALIVKAASSHIGSSVPAMIDESMVAADHLGTLLESQLHQILELAHKRRYQPCLQMILLDIITRLAEIYTVDSHPIRRARVAALVLRGVEQFPEVFVMEAAQTFLQHRTVDPGCLGKDEGLSGYMADINASLALAEAFHDRQPDIDDIKGSLSILKSLLAAPENTSKLERVVDNPRVLISQLISLEGYAEIVCDDLLRVDVAQLLLDASERCGVSVSERFSFATMLAKAHMALGHTETAREVLECEKRKVDDLNFAGVQALEYHLCRAELLLTLDQYVDGQLALEDARKAYCTLEEQKTVSSQAMHISLLHGRGWLLESRLLLALGRPVESLCSGRRAVKLLSGIWARLERTSGPNDSSKAGQGIECLEAEPLDSLANKVSKLNLKPVKKATSESGKVSQRKGAAFWPVIPVLCSAFLHLADVYVHHGIFNEANYAFEQAATTAEIIQARQLLCRVRYHRSIFLTAAGRMEDAELCLAQDKSEDAAMQPLAKIELLRVQAALASKNGEFGDAHTSIEQAEDIVRALRSSQPTLSATKLQKLVPADAVRHVDPPTKSTARSGRQKGTGKTSRSAASTKPSKKAITPASHLNPYVLRKIEARLQLEKAMSSLKMGREDADNLNRLADACQVYYGTFPWRQLEYESLMSQLSPALEVDFAFNALPETTLSFPAMQHTGRQLSTDSKPAAPATTSSARSAKSIKRKVGASAPFESLLSAARQRMAIEDDMIQSLTLTTSEVHRQSSMAANASLLLSATSISQTSGILHPLREAFSLDFARIHAAQCQNAVTSLERKMSLSSDASSWPAIEPCQPKETVTATTFQNEFVDIIPASWTVVSMSLNEDCSELFVSRYRSGQSPLILRLPFSRQKSEDVEDDLFDYAAGKAELADIIELSNYSCHSSVESNTKGAKTNWWSEREALDLRLQELLINIENIWLGGFRGIFSQHKRHADQLGRFRKALDAVLGRHLPSRRAPKRGFKSLALDDQVLELFVGLGSDQDGQLDLDEPLSDLLYFVVDMLQFNGERNAYDEIDFDSMSIEVLDALRSYHDSVAERSQDAAHVILVLDRKLHAFPWESLPCLEGSNVSRVDSMLTLRDRLIEMRSAEGRYTITKRKGSYILNPGGDLKGTESTMGPELLKLTQGAGAEWTSIVRRQPSEDEFRAALSASATLMYFGHGSGAQYIRPRAIRKLEKCSEVVWLMGCSSGAVQEYDELEPYAVPLAYMSAGRQQEVPGTENTAAQHSSNGKCMAVLATLWDVTDKDIDRFSLAVGEEWGLWRPPPESTTLPVKTPKKRVIAAPVTPQKTAKTPKTPKVKSTPAAPKTPARSASRQPSELKGTRSLVEAVAKSRDACYLRYLNGAAPVVYGVPVWLGD